MRACVCRWAEQTTERQKKAIRNIVALTLDFIFRLIVLFSFDLLLGCLILFCFDSISLVPLHSWLLNASHRQSKASMWALGFPILKNFLSFFVLSRSIEMLEIAFCLLHAERFFISQILFSLIAWIARYQFDEFIGWNNLLFEVVHTKPTNTGTATGTLTHSTRAWWPKLGKKN